MAELAVIRRPVLQVDVDGVRQAHVLTGRWTLGYDLRIGEAVVRLPAIGNAKFLSNVEITAGQDLANAVRRFKGVVVEVDTTFYPVSVDLICRGYLWFADRTKGPGPGNIDLSAAHAGQTDQQIVTYLLTQSGVGGTLAGIGGTGILLGTVAPEQFIWVPKQSALEVIQNLDNVCLGWRTFDTVDGKITRQLISANPTTRAVQVFTEGINIFSATGVASIIPSANQVHVIGYIKPGRTDPDEFTASRTVTALSRTLPSELSSSLIERALASDSGAGLSCEDVANWQLGEVARPLMTLHLETPWSTLIAPGDVITVRSPHALGLAQDLWVQQIEGEVDERGAWTQRLTAVGTSPNPSGADGSFGVFAKG